MRFFDGLYFHWLDFNLSGCNSVKHAKGGESSYMVEVIVRKDEPLERALRRFKKKYEKAGILKDVKRNSYYLKPSAEKRIKRSKALRRMRRAMAHHNF